MSGTANVHSIEALKDFKVAMINFAEDARTALTSVEMEVRRTRGWLEREQLALWNGQVKRREQEVANARSELHRRRLSQSGSDAISDTDQKEALKLAQRRLAEAEEKVAKVKRWIPILEQAISEYHSRSQPLGDRLSGGFENSLALLERMVLSLEAYVSLRAPSAPSSASSGAATDPTSTGAGMTSARTTEAEGPPPEAVPAETDAPPAEAETSQREG